MTLSTELLVMFRVIFIAIFSISFTEILGIPQVPADVTPITDFHQGPTRGQQKGQQLFNVAPQTSDHEATLPNAHQKPTKAGETSSSQADVLYGLPPPEGQSLKNSFYSGPLQSDLQNSDKSINYNFVQETFNSNQFRSPQDLSNEELIVSYVPPVVSRQSTNDQGSGVEYAEYAPYHKAKYATSYEQTSRVNSPTYQSQSKNIEYNTDSHRPTEIQNLRNDINNDYNNRNQQKVPNQEVTVESTPDFEGRLYQNYRHSQDVHRSEPEIKFDNPSYPNPKYEFAGDVTEVQRAQNNTTFQSPPYPNPKFDVAAIVSDVQRGQTGTFQNPSYSYPKYDVSAIESDIHRSQTEKTFQSPSYTNRKYEFPGEIPDVQRSQPDAVFQNPSYPHSKYDVSAIESNIHRSQTETNLANPSYPNPKYVFPEVISDVQRAKIGTTFQSPPYPNRKYEFPGEAPDVQHSQPGTEFQNPSYPNPKYDVSAIESDIHRSQTDTTFQSPSYANRKYEFPGQAPDVQHSQPGTLFQNPSYPNPKYDVSTVESDTHQSQTEVKLENESYANSKYELPGVISDFQRAQTDTTFQSPSYPNRKYEFPGQAPAFPGVASQNERTLSPPQQSSTTKYESVKVDVPEFPSPVSQHFGASSYRSSDGHNIINDSSKSQEEGKILGTPEVVSSDYRESTYDLPIRTSSGANKQTDQTQRYYSAPYHRQGNPNVIYETPAYINPESGVVGHSYVVQSYQRPTIRYEAPVRYIAILQKHRTPGRPDLSTESYLTQTIQNEQQTQSRQTAPGSNQNTDVPIVLPISPYYRYPTGSISSTFISKDVAGYQPQPAYVQRIFRGQTHPAASAHRDISNASPQSTYGLPNF